MNIDEQKARAAEELANAKARVAAELAREKADIATVFDKASAKTKIPVDKLMHAAVGLLLWGAVFFFTRNIWFAAGAAVVAGAGKEIYDRAHPATHTADFMDFFATALIPVLLSVGLFLVPRL
jgi:hypothetical protein